MRYPISKLIWAGLIIALIFFGAMLILPVVGAVLIGVFALSCLIWLSSKIFGFFQGGRTYTEDNPGDYYDASARTSIVPKKWNKTQAVDAEVIEIEEIKKEKSTKCQAYNNRQKLRFPSQRLPYFGVLHYIFSLQG